MIIKLADGSYENIGNWKDTLEVIRRYCGDEIAGIVEDADVPGLQSGLDISEKMLLEMQENLPEGWQIEQRMDSIKKVILRLKTLNDEEPRGEICDALTEAVDRAEEDFLDLIEKISKYADAGLQELADLQWLVS